MLVKLKHVVPTYLHALLPPLEIGQTQYMFGYAVKE